MPAAAIGPRGLWSIPRMVALLVLASATAGRAAAEPMGNLRLDAALTIRGLTTIEPERLVKALVADDDLLLLSRPQANRRLFLWGSLTTFSYVARVFTDSIIGGGYCARE